MDWEKLLLMAVMALSVGIGGGLVGDGLARICETGTWLCVTGAAVGFIAGLYGGSWLLNELRKLGEEMRRNGR